MNQFNVGDATDKFLKKERKFQEGLRMDQENYEKARKTEQETDEQLRAMEQDQFNTGEGLDFNTILQKRTEDAYANDRRSPSSPVYEVPTIDNIKRLLDPQTIKEVEEYLNSGAISLEDITEIAVISNGSLELFLQKNPNADEETKKDIWQRVFVEAIRRGKSGGRKSRRKRVPRKYIPKRLTKKDKRKQSRELKKSRKAYKKGKYYTRKKVKSLRQ